MSTDISVNGVAISETAMFQEMQYFPSESQEDALNQAARALIVSELLRQRAQALEMETEGLSQDEVIDLLLQREAPVREPTAEECERFYRGHPEQFSSSPLVEANHILLAAAPDDVKERSLKLEQAKALIERLQSNPEQFASLAQKFSACPSKDQGGSLGQLSRGQTVAEFEAAVFRHEYGLIPSPVESRYGVHVVWVKRNIPGELAPYSYVEEKLRSYLKELAERRAIVDYLHRLVEAAEIHGYRFAQDGSPLLQ
ncbi:Parvulin-like peptidyl-prolyl isomerase [Hahella chejuensis KCTC 2396]|uniref:peptidylprolyl isomerase n=1 Tax=Hahella chejuensis (strain KCTC 2396) TaxID=349521 RepID=Q2SF50_HAHCH|nr:peptidylprolyl isomerase [Hahella chejuensis]ABC30724.1 Parvulin-like peptidyl-prolyl isomerase [Hahella chejuensis KCTC 2396]